MAHDDRDGLILLPVASPSFASMNTSSRNVWKSYETLMRDTSPSLCSDGNLALASCGR